MSILASACAICTQCARSAHAVRTQCKHLAYVPTTGGVACQKGVPPHPGDTTWTDGSKTHHRAGWAVVTPTFQQYYKLTGPQTSYRGELMGYYRAGDILRDGMVVLDNQAVQKMAHQAPHREASDMEPRVEAAQITADKRLMSRWMLSHQDIAGADRLQDERPGGQVGKKGNRVAGTTRKTPGGMVHLCSRRGGPETCQEVDPSTLPDREAHHNALGVVATLEGGETKGVETMAMGSDAMDRM